MTELTWEGKYSNGKKTPPVRIALPFQTIETINETRKTKPHGMVDMFAQAANQNAQKDEWRNRLIWGDKKYVLPSLLPEFAGKVNLIYIDPPFDTGANFSFERVIPQDPDDENSKEEKFTKEASVIEQKAYRDTWGKGLDSFLQWFYETAVLLRELLAEDGSIYVHLDWHVGHYAKIILDEVFGYDNLRNEIVWWYITTPAPVNNYAKQHDMIFFYSKGNKNIFNRDEVRVPYSEETLSKKASRRVFHQANKSYQQKPNELGKVCPDVWDIPIINPFAHERVSYATQKPEALLERIIKASSNEGDLVLDCFCGSGTTAATAEKLGRRWITCDLGRFAIHTARKRFLGIEGIKPFEVQNLGKYERQAWLKAEFDATDVAQRIAVEQDYRNFILNLYHARPLEGYTWLHGAKAGRLVHIGSVDAPVTVEDIKSSIKEFWKLVGKETAATSNGIDFLGWDFAFETNETAKHFAEMNNVQVNFKRIPREVLEKKAVEQGDIKFYELAALALEVAQTGREITLNLSNFIMSPDDVPSDIQSKITHWSQWIDYWAVDWDFQNDTFHNQWQSYRTKQNLKLDLSVKHTFEAAGTYKVLVKVIDILGNDTTKLLNIEIL
jgi:adenine-specific DNA-methyltransferase